jgi:hypothetical protein
MDKSKATVRYMIDDVAAAITFYTTYLDFEVESEALPAFAAVTRGPLRLLLSGPASSGRRPLPDGRQTVPGGWNRIQNTSSRSCKRGRTASRCGASIPERNPTGVGGSQILFDDPSGNPIELFQPAH